VTPLSVAPGGPITLDTAKKTGALPISLSSLDRFVRGAMLASGDGDPIARVFATLVAVVGLLTRVLKL
jgi:hypothetical protein